MENIGNFHIILENLGKALESHYQCMRNYILLIDFKVIFSDALNALALNIARQ
jgi:hypothetical protein